VKSYSLGFSEQIDYTDKHSGIELRIILSKNSHNIPAKAKLDTGSTFCIFQKQYAELLNIEIEKGEQEIIRTATGKFIVYGHELVLKIKNLEWETTVYFVPDEQFPVSVLGRIGFLDRLQIGLIDYEQLLFIDSLESYYQ
jgi:hypothetical protein